MISDRQAQPDPADGPAGLAPTAALRTIRAALSDGDLTSAEKAVVTAIVCQADTATGCAWASYRQLAAAYGMSPKTIRAALAKASGRYLDLDGRGCHSAGRYRIRPPASASPTEALAPASASPAEAPPFTSASHAEAPPAAALPSGPSSASPSEAILTPDSILRKRPPYPPGGGRQGSGSSPVGDGDRGGEPAAVEAFAAAYAAAYDGPLPRSWARRLDALVADGDAGLIADVTPQVLHASEVFRQRRRLAHGVGTVLLFLRERRAARAAARRMTNTVATLGPDREPSGSDVFGKEDGSDRSEASEKARRRVAWFRTLPEATRQKYLDAARRLPGPKREDVVEHAAAAAAATATAAAPAKNLQPDAEPEEVAAT